MVVIQNMIFSLVFVNLHYQEWLMNVNVCFICMHFNMTVNEWELKKFLDLYSLKRMVREPTCFKSDNPKCINLILTNRDRSVHSTTTIETGL